jgi:hypothetical protein
MFPRVIDLIDNGQRYRDATFVVCLVQSLDPEGKYIDATPRLNARREHLRTGVLYTVGRVTLGEKRAIA